MNKYELTLVVSAKIDEEARTAVVDKVKSYIEKANATITEVNECGLKKLTYEIQKMGKAYYYLIQFDAEAGVPAQLEANIRIMESVLRYLCVRLDAE